MKIRPCLHTLGICLLLLISCSNASPKKKINHSDTVIINPITKGQVKDTLIPLPYDSIVFVSKKTISAGSGTKSVLFNSDMSSLYAMNLEGMSVYEFSRASQKTVREFRFKPTPGTGWDYDTDQPIKSFEEKPVEGCITNNDSILWVSLHNAEGIVPIHLKEDPQNLHVPRLPTDKLIYVLTAAGKKKDSMYVPLIKTGKTPKVITRTADNRFILVSNWHSYSISVLEILPVYPYAKLVTNIPVSSIPRGMVIDEKTGKSYVAIMGGAKLAVIDNKTWQLDGYIDVAANPRHLVMDNQSRLYISYNKIAKVGCVDAASGQTLFITSTPAQPRTIILSKNNRFLFATCYSADKLAVLKVNENRFDSLGILDCPGHPVGVDVYENNEVIEVWVCAYEKGTITVFTFQKKQFAKKEE